MPPGSDTNAPCGDGVTRSARNARMHAARLPLGLDQPREERAHRQPVDVAGVDAGEQRLGEVVDRLLAEAAPDERADRFVLVAAAAAG